MYGNPIGWLTMKLVWFFFFSRPLLFSISAYEINQYCVINYNLFIGWPSVVLRSVLYSTDSYTNQVSLHFLSLIQYDVFNPAFCLTWPSPTLNLIIDDHDFHLWNRFLLKLCRRIFLAVGIPTYKKISSVNDWILISGDFQLFVKCLSSAN